MIKPLTWYRPLRTDAVAHYPELARLRQSVKAKDWPAVSAFFDRMPPRADRSPAVKVVAETPRAERFLQRMVDAERDSSLARTLLGARLIVLAWKARGGRFAQHVSDAQWRVFGENLQHAERVLADATAIDPTSAAAWTERIVTARGLSLGANEGRRRYERAAEGCDAPYSAQSQLLQNLCPKWQGSLAEMHAFAKDTLETAKAGSLGGAVVAHAHVEHAFTFNYMSDIREYLGRPQVRAELAAAAAHTVLHPDFESCHGDVSAHTVFAYAFFMGADHGEARKHFAALGNRVTGYPWTVLGGNKWMVQVREATRVTRR